MKLSYEFDPFELADVEPPQNPTRRQRAKDDIADFVLTEVLSACADGRSPVSGGAWKRSLSKEYRERKEKMSGAGYANMELTGDMLDALEVVEKRGNKLSLQIDGREGDKADGHNNFSGDSDLPPRQFIPKKGETFKRDIIEGIRRIVDEYGD